MSNRIASDKVKPTFDEATTQLRIVADRYRLDRRMARELNILQTREHLAREVTQCAGFQAPARAQRDRLGSQARV
jgi:hypothetical protein